MDSTLVNKIIDLSISQASKTAVAFKDDIITYKELAYTAAGMCNVLRKNGISAGNKVCFSATSKVETIVIYLAIHMVNAVAVFLDKNATYAGMLEVYEKSDSKILLTDKQYVGVDIQCKILSTKRAYDEARNNIDKIDDINKYRITPEKDDLAEILFTSGTTGKAKGVMLSYKSVINILQNTIDGIGILNDDILLMPLPLHHSFALRVSRAILYMGATLVLQNGFAFAKAIENNITKYNCNALVCVPASYEVMIGQMQNRFAEILSNMRFIEFGAGALSVKIRKALNTQLPKVKIYNTWGSTETGGAIFCNVTDVLKNEKYVGALGKPLKGKVNIKIVDSEGNVINSSVENPGRMVIQGDMNMVGYCNDQEETKKVLKEGEVVTGDIAYILDDYVFMLGRADNIINVGGEKVSPIEIENCAGQFPEIKECACIGVDDSSGLLGQVPALFIVCERNINIDDLKKYLAERIERYKIPAIYRFIDKLPRNRMQKVDYRELHRIYESNSSEELMNDIVRTIISRRSIRRFSDKDIPLDILNMILKCGYSAPSSHNLQTWRFTVLTDKNDIERLKNLSCEAAKNNNVSFFGFDNPKVIILVSNDIRNQCGCQDSSAAIENILIAAESYGIHSVWLNPLMTLRNVSPVKELLDEYGIPDNHKIWGMVALGYSEFISVSPSKNEKVVKFINHMTTLIKS